MIRSDLHSGPTSPERLLCVDRQVLKRWLDRDKAEGLEGLDDRPRPGRPREITPEIEAWYNPHRRHSTLGHLSPLDYERRRASAARVSSPELSTEKGQLQQLEGIMAKFVRHEFMGSEILFILLCLSGIGIPFAILYLISDTVTVEEEVENPTEFLVQYKKERKMFFRLS